MGQVHPSEDDPFGPPAIPTEVCCLHCGQEYESYLIQWVPDGEDEAEGFWCCPTPGCDGKGFGFDIFPTDPEYRDEDGELMWSDDDEEFDEDEDDELDELDGEQWEQVPWDDEQPSGGQLIDPPQPRQRRDRSPDDIDDDIPF